MSISSDMTIATASGLCCLKIASHLRCAYSCASTDIVTGTLTIYMVESATCRTSSAGKTEHSEHSSPNSRGLWHLAQTRVGPIVCVFLRGRDLYCGGGMCASSLINSSNSSAFSGSIVFAIVLPLLIRSTQFIFSGLRRLLLYIRLAHISGQKRFKYNSPILSKNLRSSS